jgi:hypothetical protein
MVMIKFTLMKKIDTFFGRLSKKKMLLLTALTITGAGRLVAQTDIARYQFAQSTGTYTPITGGTVLVAANANYDDVNSSAITIPAFSYGGATITTVYVNSNGYVTFGAAHNAYEYTPLSSSGTGVTGVVSGLGCDHGYSSGSGTSGATSEIRYEQVGNEFVAQFQDVKRWNSTNERITFQIRLNSATGVIRIIYGGPIVIGNSTTAPQIGIRGNSTTWSSNVNNLRLLDVPSGTSCNWSNAVTANSNSATFTLASSNTAMVPSPGLTYTWTPATTVEPVRTFGAVTSITTNGATINFTAPAGATQYNVQYRTPGSCSWTNYAGNPVTGTSVALTGLATGTYQVRVQSVNGANTSIWSHIPNAAGTGDGYATSGTFTTLCATPAPGNTNASATSNLCAGATVSFSLANSTGGSGVTYQWQSSNDNVSYTNVSGATAATYTGSAIARYYRCVVKCSTGPDSTASNPVQLNYTNNVTSTTPGQRCGNGTVNLAAAGSAGTTLKWYAAATGGTALGTGASFTTPVINTTTPFYVGAEAQSAGEGTVGTATTTTSATGYPTAFMNRHTQYWLQMVFTAAELNAAGIVAGNITGLKFNTTSIGDASSVSNFTIMLGSTSNTTLSAFTTAGLTPVYGPSTYSQTIGINTITFSSPYNWDGTSNIIVDIRQNGADQINNAVTYYTTTSGNTVLYAFTSSASPSIYTSSTTATTSTSRLNTTFVGQTVCSSPRIAVTATVNTPPNFTVTGNQTICNNVITPLAITSALSNFNSYTWTPATNLYTDAAATIPYVAGNNATTVYFRSNTAATTTYTVNASNSTTMCAAVATSAVTVLPASAAAIASPGTLCTSGTATLNLSPSGGYGAAQFQWQSSMNNSSFTDTNGTAASYTTPTLNSTRYYRVLVKNSTGTTCFNSVSDTVRVYNPAITGTTPAARCGTGTVTLGAAGVDGTINWYAAATGGSPLASGNSFTTPSIAATTTYYAAAASGAQGTATIGAGASTTVSSTSSADKISPFDHWFGGFKTQNLITAAELTASGLLPGNISSVAFDVAAGGGLFQEFTMSIGTTGAAALTTIPIGGLTPVYTTTAPAGFTTPASGLAVFNFSTPFYWDGTANIVIQTCYSNNNTGGTGTTVKYDATPFVSHSYYQADNQTPAAICGASTMTSTLSNRPKMVINGIAICSSTPRTPVVATVNPLPAVNVTPSGTVQICAGSTTTLTATGGGNYQWRNAAGNINGQTNNTFTTGTAGTYKVVVTTPATGCTDSSAAVTVNVNPLPTVFIGNDTTFCSGNSLTLNAGNTGSAFLWNNGSTNQTRTVNTTGNYWVKVTNSNGCAKTDTIQVTVNPTPVVNLGNDTNLCLGVNYVLNAGNPGAAKLWDNGTTGQTRTVSASGTYYVRVTNSFNCVGRDTVTTTFLPSPVVNLGSDQDVCAGTTVTLDAGNPGDTYLWDNGATTQTRSVTTTGNYYVTVRNIANCKGSDTVMVTVHPLPVVNLGNDTTFCHGNTLVLNADNPGATYLWSDYSTGQTLAVNATGNYGVTVTDAYSCVGTDNINILVKDLPSGIINAVYGDTATYTFNVLNSQYVTACTWNFGDGSAAVTVTGAQTPVHHRYTQNGIFSVSVKLYGECDDSVTTSRTVDVYDAGNTTGINQLQDSKDLVLYPNPAKDLVVIENKNNLRMQHITVYNVVGQVMADSKADSNDKHLLRTATFASGIYTVRIDTDKGIVIRKFEIMK